MTSTITHGGQGTATRRCTSTSAIASALVTGPLSSVRYVIRSSHHLFAYSFNRSLTRFFAHSLSHSFTHVDSLTRLNISAHSFSLFVTHSLTHSLTHPPTHSLTHHTLSQTDFQSTDLYAACVQTEDCVEAHTNVDVVVNVNEFRALLKDCLPHVWAGKSVAEAAIPWPEV